MRLATGNHPAEEAQLVSYRAFVAMECQKLDAAEALYTSAVALFRRQGNTRAEGLVLGNHGLLHHRLGHLGEARSHFERALEIHRTVGNRSFEANELGKIAAVLLEDGQLVDARARFTEAIAIQRGTGNRQALAFFLGNGGIAEQLLGSTGTAATMLEEAVGIFRDVGDRRHEGLYRGYLGSVLVQVARLDEAAENFNDAAERVRDDPGFFEAVAILKMALEFRAGDPDSRASVRTRFAAAATTAAASRSEDVRLALRLVMAGDPSIASG